ncbi:TetR family transcriptional regulator [Paucibacter sp. Y2R2-4]|uniref:TetR family transcriptional regulator n=1 Tax=Paucibacter sp. Y2R2-4 TaxID=2893553 RepID=UPI0021E3856B|nr:TetR family transcriptional regulator [Paucibacter sp. Y2R2-4]MCV2352442.1 TetR family transcriptional regulator [Paucibacter sp. Y2R2-4]
MARKTKQEAEETRTRLLDAAEMLFQQRGVSRCSLQDIAQAAGVTRGAVYWHFQDKAELFNAMMERATMPLEEGMNPPSMVEGHLSLAELRWGLVNVFYTAMHNERTRRVFEIAMQKVEYSGEMQTLHERKLASHREWRGQNQAAFDHAVSIGQLPAGLNTRVAAVALVAMVDGLLHQWIMDPDSFDLLEVGQATVEGYLSSLAMGGAPLLPPLTPEERARLGQEGICRRSSVPSSSANPAPESAPK